MKKIKIVFKIIVFFAIFIGIQSVVKFATLNDISSYGRYMMQNLYAEDNNIDILVCGASHCQLGVNTGKMSEIYGMDAVNVGMTQQGLETSLALIKEAAKYHDLKKVFVDLDYSIVVAENPNLESIYLTADYFRPSLRKVEYLLNATTFEHYFNSFMPLHNGREYKENPKEIIEIVKRKLQPEYYNISSRFLYDKWNTLSEKSILDENGAFWTKKEMETISVIIPEKQQKNIKEMIDFCNKNNIELEFFCIPSSDFHISLIDNYDQYVKAIREFLGQYNKEYYDFNMCKEDVLPLNYDIYYEDDNHLNGLGATIFTEVLCDFYQGGISEEQLFFDSYEEKQRYSTPRFLGFRICTDEKMGAEMKIEPITNNQELDVDIEMQHLEEGYQITALIDGEIVSTLNLKDDY